MPEAPAGPAATRVACVDLWRIDLDGAEPDESVLSADEMRRARRFVFERDRRRFIAGRAGLRRLLADRLGTQPGSLRLVANDCGKPRLADPCGLSFNLSHSGALCVVALVEGGEIGVDVERVGPFEAGVAAEAFSAAECAAIADVAAADRGLAFARCWTRKEAFIKALGLGFSYPAREVTVSVGSEPRVIACRRQAGRAEDWRLVSFEPGEGFVGSVAMTTAATVRLRNA